MVFTDCSNSSAAGAGGGQSADAKGSVEFASPCLVGTRSRAQPSLQQIRNKGKFTNNVHKAYLGVCPLMLFVPADG
jgi:hypothetical protein